MEENQLETIASENQIEEPTSVDNSEMETKEAENSVAESAQEIQEGQSLDEIQSDKDPSEELILGKFKSVEDLIKAYEELQKHQGHSSEELGNLRKEMASVNELKDKLEFFNTIHNEYAEVIERDKAKYSTPEYFENPIFREIYQEALYVYGANLDTERMIDLMEKYVAHRIQANDKKKLAQKETQNILDSMGYSKNPKSKFIPPKKSFDEMTPQEVDELLDRLI